MKAKSMLSSGMNMIFMVVLLYIISLASGRRENEVVDSVGKLEKSWIRDLFPFTASGN